LYGLPELPSDLPWRFKKISRFSFPAYERAGGMRLKYSFKLSGTVKRLRKAQTLQFVCVSLYDE
jgi:hypothetical protein